MAIIRDYGNPVEQVSVDEVFVDATGGLGAWGSAQGLAVDTSGA